MIRNIILSVALICSSNDLFTDVEKTEAPDPIEVALNAVTCCCEVSGGGFCCATVPVCAGDYVPGCYCK